VTEKEIQNFVAFVLKGLWPDWTPTTIEYKVWVRKLAGYDYNKSEKALGDWLAEQTIQSRRPNLGKIFTALKTRKAHIVAIKPDPIKVFELYDQDKPHRKQAFFVGSERELRSRPAQSYEAESESKRKRLNALYGGQWLVLQDWLRHFKK
jgi:hypothetical protein